MVKDNSVNMDSNAAAKDREKVISTFAAKKKYIFPPKRKALAGKELSLEKGVTLRIDFPDEEELLLTAYDRLKEVLAARKISVKSAGGIPCLFQYDKTISGETYLLSVTKERILVSAGEREGMRRGIYELISQLEEAQGKFLPLMEKKNSWRVKNRISRSFYSPIYRFPYFIDELLSDVDYYPEPYLHRLAQEGVNGVWLTVKLREVSYSSIQKKDPKMTIRLAHLKKSVERCRKFGIKVFLFFIEPDGFVGKDEFAEEYPELKGVDWGYGQICFCPSSETAQKHLFEQMQNLFRTIPQLGGVINIPWGEGLCSCFFGGNTTTKGYTDFLCPRCKGLPPYKVLLNSLAPQFEGMRSVAPEAEYIFWFYQASNSPTVAEWLYDCIRHLPKDMIFMGNFESGIKVEQQGRTLYGGDYWQGKPGASQLFIDMAKCAMDHCRVGAKLQVSNSHELATVPDIPIPGTFYSKYKVIEECKADTLLYCWYFGCYPGLMNKAVKALSYEKMPKNETVFLKELAGRIAPEEYEKELVEAWKLFSKAFALYPVNSGIQYRGPVNAGIVWELFPEAAILDLTSAWMPYQRSGDCVGNCLMNYPIEDAVKQFEAMAKMWEKGWKKLQKIEGKFPFGTPAEELCRYAKSISILLSSAHRVMKFYLLRKELYGGKYSVISGMKKIVKEQLSAIDELIPLCKIDPFLGYHSEAEIRKFSPVLLEKQKKHLHSLLEKQLPKLEKKLASGKKPSYPPGVFQQKMVPDGNWVNLRDFRFRAEVKDSPEDKKNILLHIDFECYAEGKSVVSLSEQLCIHICDTLFTRYPVVFSCNPTGIFRSPLEKFQWKVEKRENDDYSGSFTLEYPRPASGLLAFEIIRQRYVDDTLTTTSWADPEIKSQRTNPYDVMSRFMGLLILR